MKRLGIIGIIALLVAALIFLNHSMSQNASPAPGDDDDQQAAQPVKAKPVVAPTVESLKGTPLPPEETVNDPSRAKFHIGVGWAYDAQNQSHTAAALTQSLSTIRQFVQSSRGAASAEIVNIDVPSEDRSPAAQAVTDLGVTVNGKVVIPGNLSDLHMTPAQIGSALEAAIKS